METKKELLLMAEHQFIGFVQAAQGYYIEDLVSTMGLTKKEWEILKKEERVNMIPDNLKEEIEEYFHSNP